MTKPVNFLFKSGCVMEHIRTVRRSLVIGSNIRNQTFARDCRIRIPMSHAEPMIMMGPVQSLNIEKKILIAWVLQVSLDHLPGPSSKIQVGPFAPKSAASGPHKIEASSVRRDYDETLSKGHPESETWNGRI